MLCFRWMIRLLGHKPSSGFPQPTELGHWEELKKRHQLSARMFRDAQGFVVETSLCLAKKLAD